MVLILLLTILITILYRELEIDLLHVAIIEVGVGIGGSREDPLLLEDIGLLRKGKHNRVGKCTHLRYSSEVKLLTYSHNIN